MKVFRKYGIIALMILVSGFSVFLPLYIWPKEVANDFEGIMFNKDQAYVETVSIDINGHMNRRLFGGTRFTGKIKVEGSLLPDEYQQQNIQIKFDSDGIGILKYLDESGEKLRLVEKGFVSIPMDASEFVVVLTDGETAKLVNVAGGIFISGPATNRRGAVDLTNERFSSILDVPLS